MNEMKDRRYSVLIVLTVIFFIANSWNMSSQTRELKNKIGNLNSQISTLTNQVNRMSSSITYKIDTIQDQAYNLVNAFDYDYLGVDQENKSILMEFNTDIKEMQSGSNLYLSIKDGQGNAKELALECEEGLTFEAKADLSMYSNYSVNVIEELNGSRKQLNMESFTIPIGDQFEISRLSERRNDSGYDNKSIFFNKHFVINSFGIDDLEVETARFVLEDRQSASGNPIYEEDITSQLILLSDLDEREKTLVMVGELLIDRPGSFGFVESTVTEEFAVEEIRKKEMAGTENNFYSLMTNTSEEKYYIYQKVFVYDEYPELDLKDNNHLIRNYILITFKDGTEQCFY